jgi:hypothetical protein
MFIYYNAHPKGLLVDDCINRAISVTARMDYTDVAKQLDRYKRNNDNGCNSRYVEEVLGARRVDCGRGWRKRVTAAQFCKSHPNGRYILDMSEHWSACIDGNLIDTWDCGGEYLSSAYAITPVNEAKTNKILLRLCYTARRISDELTRVTEYDGNGQCASRTVSREDAEDYIKKLQKRGLPDMTNVVDWI